MKNYLLYAAAATLLATSCKEAYDLDERLPDDFGTTLYSYLATHDYQNVKRLVDDLGYTEALSGRSLKTMFVAGDAAFARFYLTNPWGVRGYEDLSLAQKKQLLYCSMLDNSLQIMNLSNTTGNSGVVPGNAMRRGTAASVYDSVPVLRPDEMPAGNKYWTRFKDAGRSITCMRDMTTAPLTFFTEPFLVQKRITNDDINFVYNYQINRQPGNARVAGIDVESPNLRCANGFIHRMADVIVPQDNMAEVLRTTPDLSMWSSFIERFSAPFYAGRTATDNYNFEKGTQIDSLFQKRYFSLYSQGGEALKRLDSKDPVHDALLKFDPGWNGYYTDDANAVSSTVSMQKDMAVMLVPDNAALEEYWTNGTGSVLRDCYGSWDNVPDDVLDDLLNNNMLISFVGSVPSKFESIINLTNDPMGITREDVSRVMLANNGAIFVTNKVFSPTEYVSVGFPVLVNTNMNIVKWAVEQLQYSPYLNSIDARYSFFIPTNEALQHYVDPKSWGKAKKEVWHFHYNAKAMNETDKVWASVFEYDPETGLEGDSIRQEVGNSITDRLKDILDNHIVVGNVESGREYYQTKNGNMVRVKCNGTEVVSVMGSLQSVDAGGRAIPIAKVYDQTLEGNGKSYILTEEPVLTTRNSVMDIIANSDDHIFLDLLRGSELFKGSNMYSVGDIATFNNYHYTVYVPCDAAMAEYMATGELKTWDQIAEMELDANVDETAVAAERAKINAFLRYHIQDNSVYVGQEFSVDGSMATLDRNYETAIMNLNNNKFYTIRVQADSEGITLTDGVGRKRRVMTERSSDYNQPARELSSNSFAVVHRIDYPLFYSKTQCEKYNK